AIRASEERAHAAQPRPRISGRAWIGSGYPLGAARYHADISSSLSTARDSAEGPAVHADAARHEADAASADRTRRRIISVPVADPAAGHSLISNARASAAVAEGPF